MRGIASFLLVDGCRPVDRQSSAGRLTAVSSLAGSRRTTKGCRFQTKIKPIKHGISKNKIQKIHT
jgi:hypothetical protein